MTTRSLAKRIVGPLSYDEVYLVRRVFDQPGVMIDVGAHVGGALEPFARAGWEVHAFEPDPSNRAKLSALVGAMPNVTILDNAVSDTPGSEVTIYTSTVSSGISTLQPFHESHVAAATVTTVTLDDYIFGAEIGQVDFLKVDTEGFDMFVLSGFPWSRVPRPRAVVCEFEDRKTVALGYVWGDLAHLLAEQGYTVLVSEWEPIREYGEAHRWRGLRRYPIDLADPQGWGNLVAVLSEADAALVERASARFARTLPLRRLAQRTVGKRPYR